MYTVVPARRKVIDEKKKSGIRKIASKERGGKSAGE